MSTDDPASDASETTLQPAAAKPQSSLGDRTVVGMSFMFAQTIASKITSFGGQIVLAWLLLPEDFGLVAMATTFIGVATLVADAGARTVLVQKQREFHEWATSAFWLTGFQGLLGCAALLAAGPVAAAMYGEPRLTAIMAIAAAALPLQALKSMPTAALQIQLRFKWIATLAFIDAFSKMLLTILFAALGFGAYSFVLPLPVAAGLQLSLSWWASRVKIQVSPQWQKWPALWGDTVWLLLARVINTLRNTSDYVILGMLSGSTEVGLYFFAFRLSLQPLAILLTNATSVFFPALSAMNADPARQVKAFFSGARAMSIVGIPLCVLSAAASDPAVRIFFPERWEPTIPLLQLLLLALGVRFFAMLTKALLEAQSRYRTQLVQEIVLTAIFLPMIFAGAWYGRALGVCWVWLVFSAISGIGGVYLAILPGGGRWRDIWSIYGPQYLTALTGAAMGMLAAYFVGDIDHRNIVRLLLICAIGVGFYAAAIRWTAPNAVRELRTRLTPLISKLQRRLPGGMRR